MNIYLSPTNVTEIQAMHLCKGFHGWLKLKGFPTEISKARGFPTIRNEKGMRGNDRRERKTKSPISKSPPSVPPSLPLRPS